LTHSGEIVDIARDEISTDAARSESISNVEIRISNFLSVFSASQWLIESFTAEAQAVRKNPFMVRQAHHERDGAI